MTGKSDVTKAVSRIAYITSCTRNKKLSYRWQTAWRI